MGNCMSSQNIGGQFLPEHQSNGHQTVQPLVQTAKANYVLLPLSTRPVEALPIKPKAPVVKVTREDLVQPEPVEIYSRRTYMGGELPHSALPVRKEILTPLTDGATSMLHYHKPADIVAPPRISGITQPYKYKPVESIGHLHQAFNLVQPASQTMAPVAAPARVERMESWAVADRMNRPKRYAPMPGAEAFEIRTEDSIFEPTPTVRYQGPNYSVGPDGQRVGFLVSGRAASTGGLGSLQQLPEHDFQIKQPVLVFRAVERPNVVLPGHAEPSTAALPMQVATPAPAAAATQPHFSAVPIPVASTGAAAPAADMMVAAPAAAIVAEPIAMTVVPQPTAEAPLSAAAPLLPPAGIPIAEPVLANAPLLKTSMNAQQAYISTTEPLSAGPSTPAPSAASISRQQATGLGVTAGSGLVGIVKSSDDLYSTADNNAISSDNDIASPAAVVPEPTREQYDALRVFFNVQPNEGGVKMKVAHEDAERKGLAAAAGAAADVASSGIATPSLATPERSAYVVSPQSLTEDSVAVVRTAAAGSAAAPPASAQTFAPTPTAVSSDSAFHHANAPAYVESVAVVAQPASLQHSALDSAAAPSGPVHVSTVPETEQSVAVVAKDAKQPYVDAAAASGPVHVSAVPETEQSVAVVAEDVVQPDTSAVIPSGPVHVSAVPETEQSVAVVAKAAEQPATGLMGMATGMIGGMMSLIPGMTSSKHVTPVASREASRSSKASAVAGSPAPASPAITAIPPLQRLSLKQQAAPTRLVEDSLQSAAHAIARQSEISQPVFATIAPSAMPNLVNADAANTSAFDADTAKQASLSPYPSQAMSDTEYRSEFESESVASPNASNNMNPGDFDFTASVQVSDPAESGVPRPGAIAVPATKSSKSSKNKSWLSRLIPGSSSRQRKQTTKEGIVPDRVKTLEAVEDRKLVESAPVVLAPPLAPLRRGSSAAQEDQVAAVAQANATQAPVAVI